MNSTTIVHIEAYNKMRAMYLRYASRAIEFREHADRSEQLSGVVTPHGADCAGYSEASADVASKMASVLITAARDWFGVDLDPVEELPELET